MIKRLINQYLDGEIGLADKAELEHQLAKSPELRNEYEQLRSIGMHLGSIPEVSVHPEKFRARIRQALSGQQRTVFTPQRAFATSMLVAVLVCTLTFAMMMYQQELFSPQAGVSVEELIPAADRSNTLFIDAKVESEDFFEQLITDSYLGYIDPSLLTAFIEQTTVYQGAICAGSTGLRSAAFPRGVPDAVRLRLTPRQALQLSQFADGLSTDQSEIWARAADGQRLDYFDFVQLNPQLDTVHVVISLK